MHSLGKKDRHSSVENAVVSVHTHLTNQNRSVTTPTQLWAGSSLKYSVSSECAVRDSQDLFCLHCTSLRLCSRVSRTTTTEADIWRGRRTVSRTGPKKKMSKSLVDFHVKIGRVLKKAVRVIVCIVHSALR